MSTLEGAVMTVEHQDETTRLRQLIMGFRVTQLIYVAAKLELSKHLARGPQTAQELAPMVGADAGALYRLLRALASLGVFVETTDARFEMTPTAQLLQRDVPGSLRSTAMLYGDELIWRAYGQMSSSRNRTAGLRACLRPAVLRLSRRTPQFGLAIPRRHDRFLRDGVGGDHCGL